MLRKFGLILALVVPQVAVAQSESNVFLGTWHCNTGFGNRPFGLLTIGESVYQFKAVDSDWNEIDSPNNGTGIISITGQDIIAFSGPLVEQLAVHGHMQDSATLIHWESGADFQMICIP